MPWWKAAGALAAGGCAVASGACAAWWSTAAVSGVAGAGGTVAYF